MVLPEILSGAFSGDISTLENIKNNYEICSKTDKLLSETYHKKDSGDRLTHYGYQIKMLADYVSEDLFDFETFKEIWIKNMTSYEGYLDEATCKSLEYYENGYLFGYESEELGGAARIAPVLCFEKDRETALEKALEQVQISHTSYRSLLVTEFLVKFLYRICETHNIKEAAEFTAGSFRSDKKKYEYLEKIYSQVTENLSCNPEGSGNKVEDFLEKDEFPVILYICMKYSSFEEAQYANIRIKGDFAVRGIILGMIFGAAGKLGELSDGKADSLIIRKGGSGGF